MIITVALHFVPRLNTFQECVSTLFSDILMKSQCFTSCVNVFKQGPSLFKKRLVLIDVNIVIVTEKKTNS